MNTYIEYFADALPSNERIAMVRKQLKTEGVKYVLSSARSCCGTGRATNWIGMLTICFAN